MFCLILLDQATAPADVTQAQVAHVLGVSPECFASEVRPRLPCLIARGLDDPTAQARLAALQAAGAMALILPDTEPLAWLHRGQRDIGPLPHAALSHFAMPGDSWCRMGDTSWLPWSTAADRPLQASGAAKPSAASRRRRITLWSALGLAALGVIASGWKAAEFVTRHPADSNSAAPVPSPSASRSQPPAAPTDATTPRAEPRLRPPPSSTPDPHMACAPSAPPASNDEDRYLMASGQRQLDGLAQRKGATYLRLAIIGFDARCRPNAQQAYVFHNGVLLGTLLPDAINLPAERIDQLALLDETHVRYTLTHCGHDGTHCKQDPPRVSTLVHSAGGWNLVHGNGARSSFTIVDQVPPRYPPSAIRQRHQGTATLLLLLDVSGQLKTIKLEHSSGWPELDQAAIAAARQWRYAPVIPDGAKPTEQWIRVPIAFRLDTL